MSALDTVDAVIEALSKVDYVGDRQLATGLFLSLVDTF